MTWSSKEIILNIMFTIINKRKTIVMKTFAFTLAEVLITLGIIGVVAAMTLPTLMHEYKIRQYKTGFWRTSSLIQSALKETANDFGYDNYEDLYYICGDLPSMGNCATENAELFKELNDDFLSKFKVIKTVPPNGIYSFNYKGLRMKDFSGKYKGYYGNMYGITGWNNSSGGGHILIDGTLISSIDFYHHGQYDGLSITFDTNGPYKGPNQYGRDLFLFNVGHWYKLCSEKAGGSEYNGRGCYDYAKRDVNPDDKNKGYWRSLK